MKTPGIAGSAISAVILATVWILRAPGPLLSPAKDSQVRTSAGVAEKNTAAVKLSQNGPWQASRRHFAGINHLPQCQESAAGPDSTALAGPASGTTPSTQAVARRAQLWCIPGNEQVRAMIAIAADPVHTHMSLVFDRSVEAINLAAESANYVMDRYWLPWRPVSSSPDSSESSGKLEPGDESQPGLLLFRWNGPASQSGETKAGQQPNPHGATLLYVFLVSDTATDGINGEQFNHAVNYIEDVCAPQRATCGGMDAIRIMGPTFSGSLYSLRRLVESRPSQHFVAYSGTVSSVCAQLNQGLLASQQPGNQDSDPYGPNTECNGRNTDYKVTNLQFHSMVNDTETAIHRFVDMLQADKHISCDGAAQVAILSEAATAYGSAPRAANTNTKNTNERKRPCYTNFSYPREISNLRNAYQSLIKRQSTPEGGNPNASQSSLPFNFTDLQPNKSDEPPDFSSSQGPLSKEAVLMDFAADIRRQHYKYIGIIGSNVLDVMFLATFLRTACPDIRLFVINADLLFERDSDNAPYIGTLALTTYPMVGRNLVWASSGARLPRLPFADQYEESMFNAAFLLIREIAPQQNSAKPYEMSAPFVRTNSNSGTSSNSATSNNPGNGSNPDTLPLWLTVVGTGGFWPVQVILPPDRQKTGSVEQETDSAQMRRSDFSGAWKAVILTLSAVAFLQMIVLLSANPLSSSLHDFAASGPVCSQRVFFINVASSNLALCLALAAAPAWRFANLKRDLEAILISFVAAVAIVALFVTCVRLIRICRRQKESTRPASLKVHGLDALYMTIWILAVLGFYLWDRLLADDPSHYGFFFGYRATHLATGVSPLTPMLPLGLCMYLWSIFEIFRLRFNEAMRPRLNAATGFPGAMTESLIASSVKDYFLHRNYMIAFLVFFGVWLLTLHPLHPFQLFEHPEFAYLYEIWFALVLSLMLASGLRLGQIWAQVRRLLRELERSPVRHAFSRLKGEGWSPIWQSGGQEDEWTNMSRSFEVLKQVRACSKSLDPELEKSIQQAETAREQIHELFFLITGQKTQEATTPSRNEIPPSGNEVMRGMQAKFTEIQGLLAKVLNHAMLVLAPYWVTHPSDGDEPAAEEKHGSGKTADAHADKKNANKKEDGEDTRTEQLLERFVAFRYVAFIRAVLSHVRLLLIFLAISFSLMLISLNVYSFEPHQSLIWSFTAIFGVIGVTAIGVLMEAHRNEILSIITGTTPNELGIGFYVRIASLGAAPLITLMATHFPSIGRFLLSFFQPGLDALK